MTDANILVPANVKYSKRSRGMEPSLCHESSDENDYEPAPIGKRLEGCLTSPPIPPPRRIAWPCSPCLAEQGMDSSPHHLSLCDSVRRSISLDVKLLNCEDTVQLSQFITRYSALLPCQVKLLSVFGGLPMPIPKSRIINLHFIKHTKVAVLTDSSCGKEISVPLNSAAQFSVLYDPHSDLVAAMNGYHFNTVRDMMSTKPLPLIVQATCGYQGSTALSSVEKGEILHVKGIKTFLRTKQLRVENLLRESKHLSEKCSSSFTTAPRHLLLPLSSLLKLGIDLPVTVVTGAGTDVCAKGHALVMERMAGETCLIASYPDWHLGELRHFEVSSGLDVEVELVQMDSVSRQELLSSTHTLFHSFSSSIPVYVQGVSESKSKTDELRQVYCSQLLPGLEQQGVHLVQPLGIGELPLDYQCIPPSLTVSVNKPVIDGVESDSSEGEDMYMQIAKLDNITKPHDRHEGYLQTQQISSIGSDALRCGQSTTHSMGNNSHALTKNDDALSRNVKDIVRSVHQLSLACRQQQSSILQELQMLRSTVLALQKDVQSLQCKTEPLLYEEHHKENQRILGRFDCTQVCVSSTCD